MVLAFNNAFGLARSKLKASLPILRARKSMYQLAPNGSQLVLHDHIT